MLHIATEYGCMKLEQIIEVNMWQFKSSRKQRCRCKDLIDK